MGTQFKVFGWAQRKDHATSGEFEHPQEIDMKVMDPEKCLKDYEAKGKINGCKTDKQGVHSHTEINLDLDPIAYRNYNFNKEVEVCTEKFEKSMNTGKGDSGSAVIFERENSKPILVGLVSYGRYKEANKPGISVVV